LIWRRTEAKPSITLQTSDLSANLTFGKIQTAAREQHFLLTATNRTVPLKTVTHTLQSYDKGIMNAATQFGLNTDLGFTTVIAFSRAPPDDALVLSAKFSKVRSGGRPVFCKLPRIPTSDNEPLTIHLRYIPFHLLIAHIANVFGTNNIA
jgi:hypothetical protein